MLCWACRSKPSDQNCLTLIPATWIVTFFAYAVMELNHKILGRRAHQSSSCMVFLACLTTGNRIGKKIAGRRLYGHFGRSKRLAVNLLYISLWLSCSGCWSAAFMEQNWIYKAHIIGHPWGANRHATCFDHRNQVDKLVIADIRNKTPPGRQWRNFQSH